MSWSGKGIKEIAIDQATGQVAIKIKKELFRPTDVKHTYGNSIKAKRLLKWKPQTDFNTLVKMMCDTELAKYK